MSRPNQEDLLREAFKFQDALVCHAYALLRDWAWAQDAVQESYLVLVRKHEQFDPDLGVYGWIRKIVYFEALEIARKRKRDKHLPDEELLELIDQTFDVHLDEAAALKVNEEREALRGCMARLKRDAVDLLLGFYRDRFPCDQLAAIHGKSANAIRLLLSRLRRKLRECVQAKLISVES